MRRLLFALLFTTRALAGPAEDALAQELTARAPGNLVQTEKDLPVAAWGDLFESKGSPEATAKAFVEHFGPMLGFPAGAMPAEMVVLDSEKVGAGHTLSMVPSKGGVPFVAAGVTFHFDGSGKLVGVSGRFRSAAAAQMGGLDAAAAVKAALAQARQTVPEAYLSTDGTIHEYLQEDKGTIRHVYDVAIGVGSDREPRRTLLGPGGEVLEDGDGAQYSDAVGKVFPKYPSLEVGDGNLPGITVARWFDGYKLWGEHVYADAGQAVSEDDRFDYQPFRAPKKEGDDPQSNPSGAFLEVHVYHHLMKAHDRAKEWGVAGIDDRDPMPFEVLMKKKYDRRKESWDGTVNNAYFDKWAFRFAQWNPAFNDRKPAMDASVVYHEYGHFVHQLLNDKWRAASGNSKLEAEAISEGFGDYFSCAVSGGETVQQVWAGAIGEKVRRVDDTAMTYCTIADKMHNGRPADNPGLIEVHDAGKLFSGICTELRKKMQMSESEFMPRVLMSLRVSTPASFRKFGYAMLGFDAAFGEGRHRQTIMDVFKNRKVWSGCP